jgi:hypothetical protein
MRLHTSSFLKKKWRLEFNPGATYDFMLSRLTWRDSPHAT